MDFDTDEAVQKASEKDGQVVNGRKLLIAKSQPPGGGSRGRGRGRGPADSGGRGRSMGAPAEWEDDQGGRGGRGGGRGRRGGLGYNPSAAYGNMGHQRHHLQVEEEKPGARVPKLLPRALVNKHAAGGQGQQQQQQPAGEAAAGDTRPKSNEEFKKMLQG